MVLISELVLQGIDASKDAVLAFLDTFATPIDCSKRELLQAVATTALKTKLMGVLAQRMSGTVTDAVLCIKQADQQMDLHMIEIMHMRHKLDQVRAELSVC